MTVRADPSKTSSRFTTNRSYNRGPIETVQQYTRSNHRENYSIIVLIIKNIADPATWTDTTRTLHARGGLAYPSDMANAKWAVLEPLLPPASPVGQPRKWPLRNIVEAPLYLLRGGLR